MIYIKERTAKEEEKGYMQTLRLEGGRERGRINLQTSSFQV